MAMIDSLLARLAEFGQSVWCDDIGRDLLRAGRLMALVEHDGISGVTSNPTIFHRAVTESTSYDDDIRRLASGGASAAEIVETLTVEDIRLAADQLRPVFESTSTRDGWVSIEVAPSFAYDTRGTVEEVMRIKALVDRPNVLVKVPATAEGVAAIRELTGWGYSINVTLIFSLVRHREVMEAYLAGLEVLRARRAAGEAVPSLGDVHSVASFFVSRVDTVVDKRLDELAAVAQTGERGGAVDRAMIEGLRGRAAIANAKQAYRSFRDTFAGPRWEALSGEGAWAQRPLWASTGTKDPSYSDVLYVQELIGPDTVNTMPLSTIDAYRDHGEPAETVTAGVEQALADLEALEGLGISVEEVAALLEADGVKAFAASFDALVSAVAELGRTAS